MTSLPITLTAADYARLMPLATRQVVPDGIDLTLLLGRAGSWPERAQMLNRANTDPAVHGGESSMGGHLRRLDQGDRSLVALPVFPLRNFTARDLYVRKDGSVKTAEDLRGKQVGMYDWVASGSIWYRHFLDFIGVPPGQLQWWIGEVDGARITNHVYKLPEGVRAAPRPLSEMLIDGELDAIYSPPRPHRYHPTEGPDRSAVSGYPSGRTRLFPRDGDVPAAASGRAEARGMAGAQVDRAQPDRCVR